MADEDRWEFIASKVNNLCHYLAECLERPEYRDNPVLRAFYDNLVSLLDNDAGLTLIQIFVEKHLLQYWKEAEPPLTAAQWNKQQDMETTFYFDEDAFQQDEQKGRLVAYEFMKNQNPELDSDEMKREVMSHQIPADIRAKIMRYFALFCEAATYSDQ